MPSRGPQRPTPDSCAILAGGAATRLGGEKAMRLLGGRPLAAYAIEAASSAGLRPLLIVKEGSSPGLLADLGAELIREPATPRHPLLGIATALERVSAPIVCCPCDMPLLGAEPLRALAEAPATAPLVVVSDRGRLHPLLGRFDPEAAVELASAARSGGSAISAVRAIGADTVELSGFAPGLDPDRALSNVNDLDALADAEAYLGETGSETEPPGASR